MKTEHVNRNQIIEILKGVKGATFATMTIETVPNLRKTDNPYIGRIKKIASHNVCLNFDYQNSVNRQLVREHKANDFKAESTWGEHVTRCIVKKEDKYYIQAKLEKTLDSCFVVNGEIIERGLVKPFEYVRPTTTKQNVEKQVRIIKPKLDNMKELILNKTRYVII